VALDAEGSVLLDRSLPQDEAKLVELIEELREHGRVLFVVDQPATIGALPLAVARSMDVDVGYLPGLAMRRIADLHAGEAKTDARDAAIIAQAARTMPHALRALRGDDDATAELTMLAGFDEDHRRPDQPGLEPDPGLAHPDPPSVGAGAGPEAGPSRSSRSPRALSLT